MLFLAEANTHLNLSMLNKIHRACRLPLADDVVAHYIHGAVQLLRERAGKAGFGALDNGERL